MSLFLFGVLAVIASMLLNGYAFSVLRGWFIVPVFGVPALSVMQAVGIATLISMLSYKYDSSDDVRSKYKKTEERVMETAFATILPPLFFIALGYLIHLFT